MFNCLRLPSPLPPLFAGASTSPFAAFLWILQCVVTMEMGPYWVALAVA